MNADILVIENNRVSPASNQTGDSRSKPLTPNSGDRSSSRNTAGKDVSTMKSNPFYGQYCFAGEAVSDVAKEYFWPHKTKPSILQSMQGNAPVPFLPPIKSQSQISGEDNEQHPKVEFQDVEQHQVQKNHIAHRKANPHEPKESIRKIQDEVAHKVNQEILRDEVENRQRILSRKEKINEGFWKIKEARDSLTQISRSAMPSMESTISERTHPYHKAGSIEAMVTSSTQGRHSYIQSHPKSHQNMRSSLSFDHGEGRLEDRPKAIQSPLNPSKPNMDEPFMTKGVSPKERKRNSYNEVMFFDSCEYLDTPEADATADRSGRLRMAHRNLSFHLDD